jgi:hypothetical protein
MLGIRPVAGQTTAEPLRESEVTAERLQQLFQGAFLGCEIDDDGDLLVREEGVKTFVQIDEDRKLLNYLTFWSLRPEFSEAQKLSFVNAINKRVIIARFYVQDATTLVCDYQISFESGVSPYQIVSAYRWFRKVVVGAIQQLDPLDIVGSGGQTSGAADHNGNGPVSPRGSPRRSLQVSRETTSGRGLLAARSDVRPATNRG